MRLPPHKPQLLCEAWKTRFLRFAKKQACCGVAQPGGNVCVTDPAAGEASNLSGEQATLFLNDVPERLTVVLLDDQDNWHAIAGTATAGVVGGTIYGALLLHCALKAKAKIIYTWNVKHYGQFGPKAAKRVRTR